MCHFISWTELDDQIFYINDDCLTDKRGKKLIEHLGQHYRDDIKGHGAIDFYWNLEGKGTHKEYEGSNLTELPNKIVVDLLNYKFTKIGFNLALLNKDGKAEYKKIERSAYDEYEKTGQPAYAEYMKIREPAYAEYKKIREVAYAKYEKINQSAYAEYEKIKQSTYVEYTKIRDAAYAECEKIDQSAYAEYEKIKDAAYDEYMKIRDAAFWKVFKIEGNRNLKN